MRTCAPRSCGRPKPHRPAPAYVAARSTEDGGGFCANLKIRTSHILCRLATHLFSQSVFRKKSLCERIHTRVLCMCVLSAGKRRTTCLTTGRRHLPPPKTPPPASRGRLLRRARLASPPLRTSATPSRPQLSAFPLLRGPEQRSIARSSNNRK